MLEPHTPTSICGCPADRVCVALRQGLRVAEGRMFSVSNDIEHAVAHQKKKGSFRSLRDGKW